MRFYWRVPNLQLQHALIRTTWEGLCAQSLLQQQLILDPFTEQLYGGLVLLLLPNSSWHLILIMSILNKPACIHSLQSHPAFTVVPDIRALPLMMSHRTTTTHTHRDRLMHCLSLRSRWEKKKRDCQRYNVHANWKAQEGWWRVIMQRKKWKDEATVKVFRHEQLKWMKAAKMM